MERIKHQIIDIHAHILPGVDDGSRSMEESVEMLMTAAAQGIIGVIATPHYSRRRVSYGLDELVGTLRERIREVLPDFEIWTGQETYYHEELTARLQTGEAFPLAKSRYVLVEFEYGVSYKKLIQGIGRLLRAGWYPVLAHVERYICLRQENIGELASGGCWLQMNYESLEGRWYQTDTRWCRRQVENGRIHLLATDMHRMDYRPPEIEGALRWLEGHVSQEYLQRMVYQNPLRIIGKSGK